MTKTELLLMILVALKFFEISIKLAKLFILSGMDLEEYSDYEDDEDEEDNDEH